MLIQNISIAILGGGPGGLTLARLLQLKGAHVKVYERDHNKDARVQGTTLDLHEESGLAALQEAGLMDVFKQNYRPGAEKIRIVDNNATVFYDEHTQKKEETFGSLYYRPEIDRGPLRNLLLESLQPDTIIWNSQFVDMEGHGNGWSLYFKNGTTAYADLVIGADGANSRVRPYITSIKAFYTGVSALEGHVHNAAATVPHIDELLQGGKIFAFGDGQCLIVSAKGDGSLAFYTSLKTEENWIKNSGPDFNNTTEVLSWFKQTWPTWSDRWKELFENATPPFIPRPIYCMPLDQTWKTLPNLTLLGDAAHLMPPFAGEGVNMAMLDALELSQRLTSDHYKDLPSALFAYEDQMRKRSAIAAQESLENTDWMHAEGALARMLPMFPPAQLSSPQ